MRLPCGVTQANVDSFGSGDRTVHRQHDSRGKHRIDERVGVPHEQKGVTVRTVTAVGVVASGLDF